MLKSDENERLTRVGADTPMGKVLRHYWYPACLSEELEAGGSPQLVELLGQRLVAFRSPDGEVGILDEWCPHRAASLVIARNEDCGLRCIYHGWKVGRDGRLLDVPTSADPTRTIEIVRHGSYPAVERGGAVWTYLGSRDPEPELPGFAWLTAPASHRTMYKVIMDANWAQAIEGLIDSAHAQVLHQDLLLPSDNVEISEWTASGQARNTTDPHPALEVDDRPYGFRYAAIRDPLRNAEAFRHVRTTLFIAPIYVAIPALKGRGDFMTFVPMNDNQCVGYGIHYSTEDPLPETFVNWWHGDWQHTAKGVDLDENYRKMRTETNKWQQDRAAMTSGKSFSGIAGIFNEDSAVVESMGSIVDRRREHLGPTDTAVIRFRRMMLRAAKAVEEGRDPVGVGVSIPYRDLTASERLVPNGERWQDLMPDGMA